MNFLMTLDPFYPGEFYHIYNRANGFENIFYQKRNYYYFLDKYKEKMTPVLETYAYCLLPNHFHFLVKVRSKVDLVKFIINKKGRILLHDGQPDYNSIVYQQQKGWLSGFVQAINKQEVRKGSLLMKNTRRKIASDWHYLINLMVYIHQNPVHHGYARSMMEWQFSSFRTYLAGGDSNIEKNVAFEWFSGLPGFIAIHENDTTFNTIYNPLEKFTRTKQIPK